MADSRRTRGSDQPTSSGVAQLSAVASLGSRVLAGVDLDVMLDDAANMVAAGLRNEYAVVFELLPGGDELFLRAGTGLREGLVGATKVGVGVDSQAAYTLAVDEPVIIEDLSTDPRFTKPALMVEHDVVSGISVVIRSCQGPWGVLGSHTTRHRRFSGEDVDFAQAMANGIGAALEHHRHDEMRRAWQVLGPAHRPPPQGSQTDQLLSPEISARMAQSEAGLGAGLTRREREVLELVAAGKPTPDIAERLDVSVHTVRKHVQSILGKLGAHSKLEAVTTALREGIIRPH